jgi:hypothetical protein
MNNIRINDLSRSEFLKNEYDLVILTSGYEPRCTHIASLLSGTTRVNDSLVFSYEESKEDPTQIENEKKFESFGYDQKLSLNHNEVKKVYQAIIEKLKFVAVDSRPYKLLIDYSSMSRNWYAAILNYLFNFFEHPVEVTFVYSCAEYPINSDFLDFELGDVKILPGCQGSSITKSKTAGIFMLGFDKIGPLSFHNLLEPNLTYGMLSAPGSLPNYEQQARDINAQFIQHQLNDGKNLLCSPIFSVSQTFENLCQLIRPIKDHYNISVVQFGPKPHLLASILAGISFKNVSCIYSEYKRSKSHDVKASGELVVTSIIINHKKSNS